MKIVETIADLRAAITQARRAGRRIGFVPTMGALHAGHLSLLRLARGHSDFVVVSIFVNPTQFGPHEDFARYPRPLAADTALCADAGVDLLFTPGLSAIYPEGAGTTVTVEGLSDVYEGEHRPGHFRGVATVVAILFNLVAPDVAVFGQKDGQQVAVIEKMVRDLGFPIEIVVGATVREADGLALSSRNAYLTPAQRAAATVLFRALEHGRQRVMQGCRDPRTLDAEMRALIAQTPEAKLDYLAFVDPKTLKASDPLAGRIMACLAVRFGTTRLIDNMSYEIP
jgi:pantoate--beta-alanine ligase